MERTFVTKLLNHAKKGRFHPDHENTFAITNALEAVHKCHGIKIDLGWGKYVIKFLCKRHNVFGKLIARQDVICNTRLLFVTALDSTWKEFCKESYIDKCYVNAYEDMWDDLCNMFAQPVDSDSAFVDDVSPDTKEEDAKDQSDHTIAIQPSKPSGVAQKDPCPHCRLFQLPARNAQISSVGSLALQGLKDKRAHPRPIVLP
ncbi:UNVERIFIED_CONTAM: hypothetical protein Sindi_2878900 [Sesamum indicum]